MRVAVFRQTGFIAPHVIRTLLKRGHDVVTDGDADAVICAHLFTESDAAAAIDRFRGRTGKLVVLSSGDVYRAYGKLQRTEPGDLEPLPITEDSPVRTVLYPYPNHPKHSSYEKILVERTTMSASDLPACVLRLPAVYGPGDRHRRLGEWIGPMLEHHPSIRIGAGMAGWRWAHGYVENIAAAIAVATTDPRTAGRTYNIGEEETPTMRERIEMLARILGWTGSIELVPDALPLDFRQDMLVSTNRFRDELGFRDPVPTEVGLERTAHSEAFSVQQSALSS